MSIVKLKKVTLIGPIENKFAVLDGLQALGLLHLISLEDKTPEAVHEEVVSGADTKLALRYLREYPYKRKQVRVDENFDMAQTVRAVLANRQARRDLTDERDALLEREKTLTPWGDFSFPPLNDLADYRLWFYILPKKHRAALATVKYPWQVVHENNQQLWVVLISRQEPPEDVLPAPRFHTGKYSLDAVKNQREKVELALDEVESERQQLTRWITLMKLHRARAEDTHALYEAQAKTWDTGKLFVIQGWLAEKHLSVLAAFTSENQLALYPEDVADEELPPTLLENPSLLSGGQDLVNFYQTPAYRSWDPSRLLFISFSLFFAMIMSDAGYSAIMLIGVLFFWKKLGASKTGSRLRPLLVSISAISVTWGVLVGSYFGNAPPGNFLQALHFLDINDFDNMMLLSVGIGVLHILLANLEQAIRGWGTHLALLHSGWIAVLLGGFGYAIFSGRGAMWANGTIALIGGGLFTVFLGGSNRKIDSVKNAMLRFLEGLRAVTNITSIFGDVLSYLRLFALGLASASLALTFNDLANNAFASQSGLGLLGGLLILLLGHTLNFALTIVSGVVHGLRLNFIEFYKWALYGEGYPFRAFKKQEFST